MRVAVGGTINHFTVGYTDASQEPAVLLNYSGDPVRKEHRLRGPCLCVLASRVHTPDAPANHVSPTYLARRKGNALVPVVFIPRPCLNRRQASLLRSPPLCLKSFL